MRPLTEAQMAVIDAALAEELTELLDLSPELLERYRAQVAGRRGGSRLQP
ncbi:hypothetical protein ABGB12_16220 [Actinocorallia sp. B10E7]